ncbi:MAG TPA: lipid-A-disaccharide synthase [Thermoanaerobaculia bacterium]|nr:lipid-A-disaccharide synthase [Thermoanaerobaculia bacterium]HUM31263.1 lipid-A-disaccharide synthase [Thermoanaerobaculia bacterium]HXK69610.1 lipid-A-disaccharide synthase [Thermoanaerobaculia bacterium]
MAEILVVAAEASADRYAGKVLEELSRRNPALSFWGIGGDACIRQGLTPVAHASDMAVMGLLEVLRHYRRIRKTYRSILRHCRENPVKAALLLDYPGFNFPLMRKLHAMGIPVIYYICPQVWAWKEHRVQELGRYAARRIVIFPFEVDFFRERGVEADYLGHPLVEDIPPLSDVPPSGDRLALLPGSRLQEVRRHFPLFLEVAGMDGISGFPPRLFPSPTLDPALYQPYLTRFGRRVEQERSFQNCRAALVASGTATLEAALHGVPSVVVYRLNPVSAMMLRPMVRVDHISIVNILAGKKIFPEFLQNEAQPESIRQVLAPYLSEQRERRTMHEELKRVRSILGENRVTPALADLVLEYAA